MQINVDLIYPIGSIYMTTSTVSPAVLFGGTWERIKGRCIVGVDENDTSFNTVSKTGGSKYLQKHKHIGINWLGDKNQFITLNSLSGSTVGYTIPYSGQGNPNHRNNIHTSWEGTGNSGNLQPYYTAYIWRRTA